MWEHIFIFNFSPLVIYITASKNIKTKKRVVKLNVIQTMNWVEDSAKKKKWEVFVSVLNVSVVLNTQGRGKYIFFNFNCLQTVLTKIPSSNPFHEVLPTLCSTMMHFRRETKKGAIIKEMWCEKLYERLLNVFMFRQLTEVDQHCC